jgi:hypothetical protein
MERRVYYKLQPRPKLSILVMKENYRMKCNVYAEKLQKREGKEK